jgi:hypothetical protein
LVQRFGCGDEPYECEVTNWIKDWIWSKPSAWRDRTLIAVDQAQNLVAGYGTWGHVEVFGTEPVDQHLEIAWFGIDSRYKGTCDSSGAKVADLVYASVEKAAVDDPQSNAEMPLTLTCHVDNLRGRRFWERQGYELVGPPNAEVEKDRYHRMVR